jgi:hypothetical protein
MSRVTCCDDTGLIPATVYRDLDISNPPWNKRITADNATAVRTLLTPASRVHLALGRARTTLASAITIGEHPLTRIASVIPSVAATFTFASILGRPTRNGQKGLTRVETQAEPALISHRKVLVSLEQLPVRMSPSHQLEHPLQAAAQSHSEHVNEGAIPPGLGVGTKTGHCEPECAASAGPHGAATH